MITVPIPLPELSDYAATQAIEDHGSVKSCRVQSYALAERYLAEWIEANEATDERFASLRLEWQNNVREQPIGSLKQHQFHDHPHRLTRVIDVPRGLPLRQHLAGRRFELRETLQAAISLTTCLEDWHRMSRVHGWLSPQNVFCDAKNQVELRDVSVLNVHAQQDILAFPVEDLVFISPESSGLLSRKVCPASDLYSVGAILFSMISGRSPIEATNASDYFDCQLSLEPPRLRELGLRVPAAVDDLVARLLRRDPRDRYETASGLLYDLQSITEQQTSNSTRTFAIGTHDIRPELAEASLVGRDEELETIQKSMMAVQAGQSQLHAITGAEIGHRRAFADEVLLRAKAEGLFVFRGGASSSTNPKPLQSLDTVLSTIELLCQKQPELAARLAESTKNHAATLRDLWPALAPLWPGSADHTGPEAYGSQRAAIALAEMFAALAKEPAGVVLLFDDLDVADELSRTVIRTIMDQVALAPGHRMLCVVTGESAESLNMAPGGAPIRLGRLSSKALELHLESTAGKISESIKCSIVDVADGSVTMASALLRRMIDTKVVTFSEEGWVSSGQLIEALRGDESFAELLDRQVNALSHHAMRILASAAVIGQQFHLDMLTAVTGIPYAEVLQVVNESLGRRILWRETRAGWFCFANDPIHQQLRKHLDPVEHRGIHKQTVAYLCQHDPENLYDLAFHYDAAGDGELALTTSLRAARAARQRFSLSVAQDQLEIAKRWFSSDDRATGLEIFEGLGTIHLLAGRYNQAADHLYEALELADTAMERARIQQQIGEVAFKRGRFNEAAAQYEQALAVIGIRVPANFFTMFCGLIAQIFFQVIHSYLPVRWIARNKSLSETDCLRLELLSRLSRVYWFSRHTLWTLGNHLRSLNEAERFQPSATLASFYSEHGPVMSLLRWFGRANRYAERSLAIRTSLNDAWGQGQSHHYHSVVMLAECRFDDAIETSKHAVELLRQTGDVWEMNMARYQSANALYRIGRYAEAAEVASQMFESGRQIGDRQATGISLDVWARTTPQTLSLSLVLEEAARSRPDAQSHAQTQLAFAVMLLHHDRVDEAVVVLQDAIKRCEKAGHLNTYICPCYVWLGTAMRRQLELIDRRDGRCFRKQLRLTRAALHKAATLARGFPADLAQVRREIAILHLIRGNMRRAAHQLQSSLKAAKRLSQVVEERDSLQLLQKLYEREPDFFGTFPESLLLRLAELKQRYPSGSDEGKGTGLTSTNLSLADRFVTVLKSGRRIAQALSADLVFAEASESARRLLRGQHVDVVTIHQNLSQLVFKPWHGKDCEPSCLRRTEANEKLIRMAVQTNQAVCLDYDASNVGGGSGSAIAAPIAFRGDPVAVILVSHLELKDLFGADERRIADFVTTLAGAALENADGFLRLQQMNDTLEQRVLERTKAAEDRAGQLSNSNEQLRATEEQLRRAIAQANTANEAKSRFLATISHEIRTPLNGILGMTRLARDASSDPRQTGYLETVEESGQSLLTLINDLLDFSKLEANKMDLERIPMDLECLAGEVSRLMAASAWQKGVELVCDVDPHLPKAILGDPARLRQIIMNLIGNAIKFTEQGYISLTITTLHVDSGEDLLSIEVQDSGIGIPVNQQDKVFESFSQADSSTTRRYGGTGLGLAICRELAERMQGTIELRSVVGVGSTFTLLLPLELADEQPLLDPCPVLGNPRVAIIDPLDASARANESALGSIGANVQLWPCRSKCGQWQFDADFFDNQWDLVIFGCDKIEHLADQCAELNIPCLFLLPAHATLDAQRGEWSAELRKPVLASDLLAKSTGLLRRDPEFRWTNPEESESSTKSLATEQRDLPKQSETDSMRRKPKVLDQLAASSLDEAASQNDVSQEQNTAESPTRILVAEDGVINQEVIMGILEMQGYVVVVASDGVEAVELAQREVFDICLMDVDMPRLDGIDATKLIREQASQTCQNLPIIAMTAHSDDQIWEACEAAGMNGYLAKPIQPETLFEIIERHCVKASSGAQTTVE
ncbi:protein containing ATP-binding region, ATPase-like protein [Rhodopirellula maiorica SM1]|uniref:histidine kinase n=1 Tax=Rhodopirellula maiorica SM1 TaxID=1265738 RepID=M5RSQ0_9BACT|nr:ATP-binding protein [Rhodopirellula maiorica]EMI22363.1 protein containing ATP-binding region, ATPase-like protein [Rhodopirellula maiorica SM1]